MAPAEAKLKGVIRLEKGGKVQVKDLQNSKELNGLVGELTEFDQVKMRWGVKLDGGKLIALKMNNLLPVSSTVEPAVEIPFLGPTPVGKDECGAPEVAGYAAGGGEGDPPPPPPTVASADVRATDADAAEEKTNTDERATDGDAADENKTGAALAEEEWPALPCAEVTPEMQAKARSGCWWDGGSATRRFAEQLRMNDATLLSVCLVPPKRFNEEDAEEICSALEVNSVCNELVASGHPLSEASCQRLAQMLRTNKTLQTFSVGEASLGELACILFDGLSHNISVTSLDLELKGLNVVAFRSLASALDARKESGAAPLSSLRLSRNPKIGDALAADVKLLAPRELQLSEVALGAQHGSALGEWVARGVEDLDLRDNSGFGGGGVEALLTAMLPAQSSSHPPVLRRLRLDGCCIGDDGLEAIAEALTRGLQLEDLFVERCELTVTGCTFLADALRGKRLRTLSARANVIGDEGCSLLARCAERLDLSATSLSGQVLQGLGEQPLVALELFSNPALGPSVAAWCDALDSTQWQRLEYLDLTGCGLQDAGLECVINTLTRRLDLMPSLTDLLIGANDATEDDAKWELVESLGAARGGKLSTKWANV